MCVCVNQIVGNTCKKYVNRQKFGQPTNPQNRPSVRHEQPCPPAGRRPSQARRPRRPALSPARPAWPWYIFGKLLANVRQIFARFQLYRRRSLQVNKRFAAFFKIYQITK